MKILTFLLLLLSPSLTFAQADVCCVLQKTSGDSVQTFVWALSSLDCKPGKDYQGAKICTAVADPQNVYCSSQSNGADRCAKCGMFWSGKECLTKDPKDKAKEEIKEEMKKQKVTNPDAVKLPPATPTPTVPGDTPVSPPSDDGSLFNRSGKSKNEGIYNVQ